MTPDPRFIKLPKSFWAFVRLIGQECGYTERGRGEILVPSREKVESRLEKIDISPGSLTRRLLRIETAAKGKDCDYDPRALTTITSNRVPLRTFARRMDGAFPSVVNPIAVWEIKEYYYTTTFGSRVADGVYETLLDGMEIEELATAEDINVLHYLMIDAHYTWWECGKSYLCRIVDMLHMGYVDEVLVGREIFSRLPSLVNSWVKNSPPIPK